MKLQMGSQYQKERRQIRLQVFSVLRDLPKRHSTRLQKNVSNIFAAHYYYGII